MTDPKDRDSKPDEETQSSDETPDRAPTQPEDDAPAIRLSWSSTMNQREFQKGVSLIAERLGS